MNSTLTFDEKTHRYYLNGRWVMGVTESLRLSGVLPTLPPSARIDYKASLGTAAHVAVKLDAANDLDESSVTEEVRPFLKSWRRFRAHRPIKRVVASECYVLSRRHLFAGRLDLVIEHDESRDLWLYEVKTGAMQPAYRLQTAAYMLAWNEEHPDQPVTRRAALQLIADDDAIPFRVQVHEDVDDKDAYLAALRVAHWKVKHGLTT
jgi:hypothetical protein